MIYIKIDNIKVYCIRDNNDDIIFVIEKRNNLNVESFVSYQYYLVDKDINVMQLDEATVLNVFSNQKKIVILNEQQKKQLIKNVNKKTVIDTSYGNNQISDSESLKIQHFNKYLENKRELYNIIKNNKESRENKI